MSNVGAIGMSIKLEFLVDINSMPYSPVHYFLEFDDQVSIGHTCSCFKDLSTCKVQES